MILNLTSKPQGRLVQSGNQSKQRYVLGTSITVVSARYNQRGNSLCDSVEMELGVVVEIDLELLQNVPPLLDFGRCRLSFWVGEELCQSHVEQWLIGDKFAHSSHELGVDLQSSESDRVQS